MTAEMIYHAFISHAHEDARVARWLHRALETYRVPLGVRVPTGAARLIGAHPFYPCFLDREELRSGELSEQIIDAARRSKNLVVLCSIHSRESEWVELEVGEFLKKNPVTRVFPVLTGDTGALQEIDLFPKSLRAALKASEGEIGALSLLAIDLRSTGDGARRGLFKLIAGTSGILFRDLVARQASRARRTRLAWATAAVLVTLVGVQAAILSLNRTGLSERQRRIDIAQEQLEFGNQNQIKFMMGTTAESIGAIYSNPVKCDVGIGGCGYFDEEFGNVHTSSVVEGPDGVNHEKKVNAGVELAIKRVAEKIQKDRDFQNWSSTNPFGFPEPAELPPDMFSHSVISSGSFSSGPIETADGDSFYLSEQSVSPRGNFLRKSWVVIWKGSVPDLVRAEALGSWGRFIPLSAFLLFVLFQFLSLGRILRREPG